MTDEQLTRIVRDFMQAVKHPHPDNNEVIRSVAWLVEERGYEETVLQKLEELKRRGGLTDRRRER